MKNEVKKKMTINSRKSWHQSHRGKNFFDECQPFFFIGSVCTTHTFVMSMSVPQLCFEIQRPREALKGKNPLLSLVVRVEPAGACCSSIIEEAKSA
jgi:hypothetical protein